MRKIALALLFAPAAALAAPLSPDTPSGADAARDAELAALARPLLEAHLDGPSAFLRDNKGVVFVSNRDGLPQLYVADGRPDAPARRLTTTSERVSGATVLQDGRTLVFRSDRGADENWSIFKVGVDGKNLVELTRGEKLNRDAIYIAEDAPGFLYYTARPMATQQSTLWKLAVEGGAPKKIYTDEKTGFLTDVSRDGKRALVVRVVSRTENVLLSIDLASGVAKALHPTSGTARVLDAGFSPDGKRIFVATDGGGEQALLIALDDNGKELKRYLETRPSTGELFGFDVSPKGDRICAMLGAGAHTEVRLLDAKTLEPTAEVKLPLGVGSVGRFSTDGARVTLEWSTPTEPSDLYALDVKTSAAQRLRSDPRPHLAKLPPVEVAMVEAKAFDGGRIPMNVYRPRGDGKRPVIVSFHGGPAGVATMRWNALASFFVSLGYVFVEPNVRGSAGFGRAFEMADNGRKRVDALKDIDAVGQWAAAQPWADKDRVAVMGGSYGGYTTLIALTRTPGLWRAGVDLFGVANWKSFMLTTSGVIRDIFRVEIGELGKDDAFLDEISPLKHVDKIARPLFVYAGANDPRVPRSESDLIVEAVRKRGVPVEYMVKDDEGHSLARRPNQIELYARAARFLEKHLRGTATAKK